MFVIQRCIPACRRVFERLTSLPLYSDPQPLYVCVRFKAAALPEQIIYRFFAVYSYFIKVVSFAAFTSALTKESEYDAAVNMLLYVEEHLFLFSLL